MTYEICWIRKASLVFGTSTFALSTVLAVFFAGLAVGSYAWGKYSRRTLRPLRIYAMLEIGVGLLALLSPVTFTVLDTLYGRLYPHIFESFVLLSFTRFILVVIVIFPPSVLMGGTLPLFCRQYVLSEKRISRSVGFLYGLNTLGAAAGCATCGFLMIPRVGVNATIWLGGALNIVIGIIAWTLSVTARALPDKEVHPPDRRTQEDAAAPVNTRRFVTTVSCLFLFTGFVALGNEVLWSRYLSLLMHNTVYAYTVTLTVILVGIVIGSVLTAGFFDRLRRRALVFGAVHMANGIVVLTVLMLPAAWWRTWLDDTTGLVPRLWVVMVVLLIPAILSGISFPLAIRMVVDHPAKAGAGVGKMTALNTGGGIAGALTCGFFVLPVLGLRPTLLTTTGISMLIGIGAWLLLERTLMPLLRYLLVLVSVAIWLGIPFLTDTRLPEDFLAQRGELIEFREGLGSHMAVVRQGEYRRLEIDRLWQGVDRKIHQIMSAHIPMLLHPDPKQILVIGVGTGQTASRFLMYPVEQLDCVEIEAKLIPLVKRHFDSAWMDDERVRFIFEDGRNYLTHTRAKYDVISIEVGQVFRPGVASFYTADFYRRARRQLTPNGLFCQFIPSYTFSREEFRTVIRTFQEAFPQSILWYNTSELLLIGSVTEPVKLTENRLAMLNTNEALHQDMQYAYWGGPAHWLNRPEVFVAGFLAGPKGLAKLTQGARVYHDDRPYLEYTDLRDHTKGVPFVEMIRSCMEPAQVILDIGKAPDLISSSRAIRVNNLKNIVADTFLRQVGDLRSRGRHHDAIDVLRQAVRWNPENFKANMLLADELVSQGDFEGATTYVRQAAQINPRSAKAQYNLGLALSMQGKVEQAILHYRQAVQLEPTNADAHYSLAEAYAEVGRFDDAVPAAQQALALAKSNRQDNLARQIQARIALYKRRQPYRDNLGGS